MSTPAPGSGVAVRDSDAAIDLMQPLTRLSDVMRVSDILSRSPLIPYSLRRGGPAAVFHVIVTGQALGLHWIEAVRVIYSPGEGQIGLRGAFLLSQLRKAGHDYDWSEGEGWCEFTLIRKDRKEPYKARYTLERAVQAGLAEQRDGKVIALSREKKPLPWMLYTPSMLFWRAVAECVGRGAPEISLGFEIEGDLPPEPPQQVNLQPAAPAPPDPAGEAAAGDGQAGQVQSMSVKRRLEEMNREASPAGEQQRALDEHTRLSEEIEHAERRAAGEDTHQGEAAEEAVAALLGDRTVEEATVEPQEEDEPADRQNQAALARAFASVGWPAARYKADVLRACSVFCRRPIAKAGDVHTRETARLIAELAAISRADDQELSPEARLADKVAEWGHAWREADPVGFAEWEAHQ